MPGARVLLAVFLGGADPVAVASRLAWPLLLGLVAAALGRAVGGLL